MRAESRDRYCQNCGTETGRQDKYCGYCGQSITTGASEVGRGTQDRPPDNYLVWAILTTVFCCLPAGIVSIVYSAQVNGKFYSGDIDGAERASENAKTWAIISAGLGLVTVGGIVLFNFAG